MQNSITSNVSGNSTASAKAKHPHAACIYAWVEGEQIQHYNKQAKEWQDVDDPLWSIGTLYRVKPRLQVINGWYVPAAITTPLSFGDVYYVEMPSYEDMYDEKVFMETDIEALWLLRGIMHSTKEGAIASAKARLGINPDGEKGKKQIKDVAENTTVR